MGWRPATSDHPRYSSSAALTESATQGTIHVRRETALQRDPSGSTPSPRAAAVTGKHCGSQAVRGLGFLHVHSGRSIMCAAQVKWGVATEEMPTSLTGSRPLMR